MFQKLAFHDGNGHRTAGLVFDAREIAAKSLTELSRSWPMGEAGKMKFMLLSPTYATREQAFAHDFDLGA